MMEYAINQNYSVHVYSTLRGLTKEQVIKFSKLYISSFVVHLPDKDGLMKFNADDNYLYNLELFYSLGLPNVSFMVIGRLSDKVASIIKELVWESPIITRGKNLIKKENDKLQHINSWCTKEVNIA